MGEPTIFTYLYSQKIDNILTIPGNSYINTTPIKGCPVQYRQIQAGLNIRFYHNINDQKCYFDTFMLILYYNYLILLG